MAGHDLNCQPGKTQKTDWVIGAAMLIPRAQFLEVGGFDENFFMYCEEIDLQKRLRDLGLDSYVTGKVSILHLGGKSTDPEKRIEWLLRSRVRYANKWGAGGLSFKSTLTLASFVNFFWNIQRQLRSKEVNAYKTLRRHLGIIWKL